MEKVRVRFAPSPTGSLHIGGVRTALFNYLFARHHGGKFFLRIEDTDRERSKKEFEDEIIKSLQWLGLDWDEPVLQQSERFDLYRTHAEKLVSKGLAYEDMEKGNRAIRFKLPADKKSVRFRDLVHGDITIETGEVGDIVIIKSDGTPTYNFACVIDDDELGITHIIRGDDHISNTPKQLLLYEALGMKPPEFAHLPLIVGRDRSPLSKRHAAVALKAYEREGFLPEGMANYLALLGWGPGENKEFFTKDELVKHFSLERVNKTSAAFDDEKLRWINGQHIKAMDDEVYIKCAITYLRGNKLVDDKVNDSHVEKVTLLFKERIRTLKDIVELGSYLFKSEVNFKSESVAKYWTDDSVRERLNSLADSSKAASNIKTVSDFERIVRECASKQGIKAGDLIHPTRVALTGTHVSPSLFDIMALLGKDEVVRRLQYASDNWDRIRGGK